jgi:hypothetical protein
MVVKHNMERKLIIPLTPDYDESSIHRMKQSESREINGVKEKTTIEIPRLSSDAGTYELLTFIGEFNRAREIFNWTTGPKLFHQFGILLEGFHRQTWSEETQAVGTLTVQHFADALTAFKNQLLDAESYDKQMDSIRRLQKPRDMTPGTFLIHLRIQNSMVRELPGAPAAPAGGFTDIELRKIYLQAMPVNWQSTFQDANKTFINTTLNQMRIYFTKQHSKDPYDPAQSINLNDSDNESVDNQDDTYDNESVDNQDDNSDNENVDNQDDNASDNASDNSDTVDNQDEVDNQDYLAHNQGNFGTTQGARRFKLMNSDRCPLPTHQGHTWGLCNFNKYNDASLAARRSSDTQPYPNTRSQSHALPDSVESNPSDASPSYSPS